MTQDSQALLRQGVAHHQAGRLRQAEQIYRQVLASNPNEPNANQMLGRIALSAGHVRQALALLRKSAAAAPQVADWQRMLGDALRQTGYQDDALNAYRRALKLKPDDYPAALGASTLLMTLGRFDEAFGICDTILKARPGSGPVRAMKAITLDQAGQAEAAWETAFPLMEAGESDAGATWIAARLSRRFGDPEKAMGWITRALEAGASGQWRTALLFTRADLIAATGEPEAAFIAYTEANQSVPSQWSTRLHEQYIDLIISTYGPDWKSDCARSDIGGEQLVFVVGMPRSGTSLVEQIIASHPEAFGCGELPDIRRIGKIDLPQAVRSSHPWPRCAGSATREALTTLARTHVASLKRWAALGGCTSPRVITDKMPSNAMLVGLIAQLLPRARVIHCRRDPVDTCVSCYTTYFTNGNPFTHNLEHLGHYHVHQERLMAHWSEVLDLPMLEVNHTQLVREPEQGIREIIEFCGLPWNDACLRFHESGRHVGTASYEQVRRPINDEGLSKYRVYDPWLQPLRDALGVPSDSG